MANSTMTNSQVDPQMPNIERENKIQEALTDIKVPLAPVPVKSFIRRTRNINRKKRIFTLKKRHSFFVNMPIVNMPIATMSSEEHAEEERKLLIEYDWLTDGELNGLLTPLEQQRLRRVEARLDALRPHHEF